MQGKGEEDTGRRREGESLWKTEGIPEIQRKATIRNLDKETAAISIMWVMASLLSSDLTATKSSTPKSKYLIRVLFYLIHWQLWHATG